MNYFKIWVIKIQYSVNCQNVKGKPTILSYFKSLFPFFRSLSFYQQREQVEEQIKKELTSIKLWSLLFVPDRENKEQFHQLRLAGQIIHSTNTLVLPVFSLPFTVPGSKVILESLTVPPVLSYFHPCGLEIFSRKLRQNSNGWHFKFSCTLLAACPIACSNFTAS